MTDHLLREMTEAIVQAVDPERVILFGSHARGDARPNSDVDLLVVEGKPFGAGRSRRIHMARIRQSLSRFHLAKDILVYSSDEFQKWRSSINHLVAHALREGRTLYARRGTCPHDAADGPERPDGDEGHA